MTAFAVAIKMARILLLDDSPTVVAKVSDILENEGHEVVSADNGAMAYQLYNQQRRRFAPIDLCILDLNCGVIGGERTLALLKRVDPKVKAIAFSGDEDYVRKVHYESQGFLGFVLKTEKDAQQTTLIREINKILKYGT